MIYLMRHGLDDERYVGGWSNVPLTKEGIEEVIETLKYIKSNLKVKRIVTSDIFRAVQTAEIISKELNIDYEISELLREQNKGDLNGMLLTEAKSKYPKYFKDVKVSTVYPNGESLEDLYNRVKDTMEFVLECKDTLFITHRGVINMFYFILINREIDMNKKQFGVFHASIHEINNNKIRKLV